MSEFDDIPNIYDLSIESEDLRVQELSSLSAIFPSTLRVDGFSGSIDIPLDATVALKVQDGSIPKSSLVSHLPPIIFEFDLPPTYPHETQPIFKIKSSIISAGSIEILTKELSQFWEDYKDVILYSMIDHIQQNITTHIPSSIDCGQDMEKYHTLLSFDKKAIADEFDLQTFNCQICQDDFKGANCTQFKSTCNHIFCNNCLFDFFSSLIASGEISKVHCPDYECTKGYLKIREKYLRIENVAVEDFNFNEFKAKIMTPPISLELLKGIIEKKVPKEEALELMNRYHRLFTKQQYDAISKLFPSRLVDCPRVGCTEQIFRENLHDPLVICRKCNFAFCNWCRKSWHGTLNKCGRKNNNGQYSDIPIEDIELWMSSEDGTKERIRLGYLHGRVLLKRVAHEYTMDKLFNDMLQDSSQGFQKCPTCSMITQRLDGCNKMVCSTCSTIFCNLCGIYLDSWRPYDHFLLEDSTCYGKLFEGMPGAEPEPEHIVINHDDGLI